MIGINFHVHANDTVQTDASVMEGAYGTSTFSLGVNPAPRHRAAVATLAESSITFYFQGEPDDQIRVLNEIVDTLNGLKAEIRQKAANSRVPR